MVDVSPHNNAQSVESTIHDLRARLENATYLAQHIATALYLTVEHLPGGEPLVQALKHSAVELVSVLEKGEEGELFAHRVFDIAGHVSTVLTVLVRVRLVEGENRDVLIEFLYRLQKEMVEYVQALREMRKRNAFAGGRSISDLQNEESIIDSNQPSVAELRAILEEGLPPGGAKHLNAREIVSPLGIFSYEHGHENTSAIHSVDDSVEIVRDYRGSATHTTRAMIRREDRIKQIVEIIRQLRVVSMRDIAIRITKCSEKTLQRDIAELVTQGAVIKQGSRRWATYRVGPNMGMFG